MRHLPSAPRALAAVTASVLASLALAAPTGAASAGATQVADRTGTEIVGGLLTPLSVAVGADDSGDTTYYSQNYAGTLWRKQSAAAPQRLFRIGGDTEVGAVSERRGVVTFATFQQSSGRALIRTIADDGRGKVRTLADLGRFEQREDPDGDTTYGFRDLGGSCRAQLPAGFDADPRGIVESHPYATDSTASTTFVADAGSNTVLAIGRSGSRAGNVRTVAQLPAVQVRVPASFVAANNLPACALGQRYYFEPVPTGVEVGPDGDLYVSVLPGGPEDGSLGAQGRVYRVDSDTGRTRLVAKKLATAVSLSVADNGDVYVAELYGNRVSRVRHGSHTAKPWVSVPSPGAVEWSRGELIVSTDVLSGLAGDAPRGRLVRFAA